MQALTEQLPLTLHPQELYQLTNFYFTSAELAQLITTFCSLAEIDFLYLWGKPCSGKTHLALAILAQVQQQDKTAIYLSLAEAIDSHTPELLQAIENIDLLVLDELAAIAGNAQWEEALFHCLNRLQYTSCKLLISAAHNPAMLTIKLADLTSRLATGLVYQLKPVSDQGKPQLLTLQAQARGLSLPSDVAQYLLRHHSRDISDLMAILNQLDKASLAQQRRLTIPFVRQILQDG